MTVVHRFDPPDRFVAGTVGEPGARTFFLQAREGHRVVSVALEKQQVALLAERVDELLDDVMRQTGEAGPLVPAVAPLGLEDRDPLDQPITEDFRVGTMTLSWDVEDDRLVLEIFSLDESGPGADGPGAFDDAVDASDDADDADDADDPDDPDDPDGTLVPPDALAAALEEVLGDAFAGAVSEGLDEPEPAEALVVRLDAAHARAFVKRAELVVDAGRPSCPFCGLPIDPEGHLCVRANGFRRREPRE